MVYIYRSIYIITKYILEVELIKIIYYKNLNLFILWNNTIEASLILDKSLKEDVFSLR